MNIVVKRGDTVRTKGGRERTVKKVDGRFIYFTDGSVYGLAHPDIEEVIKPKKKKNDPEEH